MKRILMISAIAVTGAALAFAQGGGPGGMTGGSGMVVVADDGSVLVTEMGRGGGMMGGSGSLDRELVSIGPDGQERWRASFDEGWPMRPVTEGDLVVVPLADDWWMGDGGMGDGGWRHMGGSKTLDGHAALVGLSLSTGLERWRLDLDGDMVSLPQFAGDGSRLYLTVHDVNGTLPGGGPLHQGDAGGAWTMMSSTLVAIDRDGSVLWSVDLDGGHMGGGPMGGGGS